MIDEQADADVLYCVGGCIFVDAQTGIQSEGKVVNEKQGEKDE